LFIGNELSNSIWAARVPPTWKTPERYSSHQDRERFIRAKYEDKLFLHPPYQEVQDEDELKRWSDLLTSACENDNLSELLMALAHGASPCFLPFKAQDSSRNKHFPLHIASSRGATECAVLLLTNGADCNDRDEDDRTAAEVADLNGYQALGDFLRRRQELVRIPSSKKALARSPPPADLDQPEILPAYVNATDDEATRRIALHEPIIDGGEGDEEGHSI
jgi:hypothetical protein